jgi:RHS repeat-associated protein
MSEDAAKYLDEIKYFDGLGRPIQTVQRGITPSKQDLVNYQEYDGFGRESNSWLPAAVNGNGAFQPLYVVKLNAQSSNDNDSQPYSYPVYEASPLNRILQQYGPGADWHSKGKAVTSGYLTNTASDVQSCTFYEITSDGYLKKNGNYQPGQLYVTKVSDEDGNTSYEFKDKLGQVILTRQVNGSDYLDTYYVYDDFGKVRFVLSPMASAALTENSTWNMDNQTLKDFAYIYKYDGWLRCIWKKIPGCEPIYYVYDRTDRLILSQDGEQRKTGSWTFNKYDALGRVVITGVHTSGRSHESWINLCKDLVVTESKGGNYGYSWNSLPEIPYTGTLLVNHYDDYEHLLSQDQTFRDKLSYTAEADYGTRYENSSCASCSAKGLLVGTRVKVMDGNGEIVTAIYYDERGRAIQTKSTNLLGGTEAEYTAYDFTGHPTARKHLHTNGAGSATTEIYAYAYDHAGRLLKTTHSLNGGATVTLSENTYDDLGRLLTSMPTNREAMKMTYRYNVRSWLASITTSSSVFSENLYYNIPFESGTACYNGNISTSVRENYLGYNYTYDNLSRLTAARNFLAYDNYDAIYFDTYNTSYSYDRNGNITALTRYGGLSLELEKLEISHNGNQMARITDQVLLYPSTYADYTSGFVSYSRNSANRYAYNPNGSMTHDPDKGADYSYNILGMASQVSVPAILGTIDYKYSATGERLEASYKWHSGLSLDPLENVSRPTYTATNSSKLRQYVGNKIYENGSLKRILFDNGYIENGIYYFYLRDHLGNNCVVGSNQGAMKQWTNYYPYGKPIASESSNPSAQPYKFGGKEQETMFGLDLYDFHARQMDSRVGSFLTVDPLAEKYYSISPYAYCAGNPVKYVDPDGRDWYRHDESGAVFWQEGNTNSVTYNDQVYRNIGGTYSSYNGGVRIDYNQNEVTTVSDASPRFNVEGGQYIPKTFVTDDGTKVKVTFNYNSSTGGNGDKALSKDAVSLFITGVNEANNSGAGITSVDVSTTTTGQHSSTSAHYVSNGGRAFDIDVVNGVSVRNSSSHDQVDAIQTGMKTNPNLRENYGPNIQEKAGKKISISGHDNHIHASTKRR